MDPNALKQAEKRVEFARASETFGTLAVAFIAKARAENLAASTLSKIVWLLDMAKADLGKMPICDKVSLRCMCANDRAGTKHWTA